MSNAQIVTILGRLGKDPEVSFTPQGTEIVNLSVAVNQWVNGQKDDQAVWYDVALYGRTAETATNMTDAGKLKTGTAVFVSGSLTVKRWTTRKGEPRQDLKINADVFRVTDPKQEN